MPARSAAILSIGLIVVTEGLNKTRHVQERHTSHPPGFSAIQRVSHSHFVLSNSETCSKSSLP